MKPFGLFLLLSFFIGATTLTSWAQSNKNDPNTGVKKYNSFMQLVKYAYVDTINETKLVEKAIIETLS